LFIHTLLNVLFTVHLVNKALYSNGNEVKINLNNTNNTDDFGYLLDRENPLHQCNTIFDYKYGICYKILGNAGERDKIQSSEACAFFDSLSTLPMIRNEKEKDISEQLFKNNGKIEFWVTNLFSFINSDRK